MRFLHLLPFLLVSGIYSVLSKPTKELRRRTTRFELDITWEIRAPDGFARPMILVNGQSPGPTLKLTEGDQVEVVVTNHMQIGTTVHFHGIEQLGTPWSDGVPGVSQRFIESGKTFTYRWTATQYGTYWYHAHAYGQLEDGFYGAILITPASGTKRPFKLISNSTMVQKQLMNAESNPEVIMVSDWAHYTSEELRNIAVSANIDVLCMDSILINGKGSVNCQPIPFLTSLWVPSTITILEEFPLSDRGCVPLADFIYGDTLHYYDLVPADYWGGCKETDSPNEVIQVNPEAGWAAINLISTSAVCELTVSIDEHPLWIYAVDGRYVEPVQVDAIIVAHGSRYSVFVQLNKPPGDYTIRVACSGQTQRISGFATLSYISGYNKTTSSKPYIDYGGRNLTADVRILSESQLAPFINEPPASKADVTYKLNLTVVRDAWSWTLNGIEPYGEVLELTTPLLWDPHNPAVNSNLSITTRMGEWVDLVLLTGLGGISHPIHKHSNKAYIIGFGYGVWTWDTVEDALKEIPESFNLKNPLPRDIFYTLDGLGGPTWTVIRYQVVNPGAFLLHCHINPHLTGGMALAMLDGIDQWPTVPKEYINI